MQVAIPKTEVVEAEFHVKNPNSYIFDIRKIQAMKYQPYK